MSIVFFGTTDTGHYCLAQMLAAGLPVAGVVTGPPEFEISYAKGKVQNLRHRSFHDLAAACNLPLLTFQRKFDEDVVQTLRQWQPQLLVVIGWYHLIPARVRALAPLGAVGMHWSLLPKYRGGSPLVWAMIQGEAETGASLFYLEDRVDTGPLVAQEAVTIGAHDDVQEMIARLNRISGRLVVEHIPRILQGTARSWPQDESRATYFPPRSPADGQIDWRWPAQRLYDFIRAQTLPYPCAFTHYRGERVRLVKATLAPRRGLHTAVRAGDGRWLGLETILVAEETEVKNARDFFGRDEVVFEQSETAQPL
ncbi:MAG: methionyl-tRNA formyltransferase [candidate division KSB1 bacterium]|nr:methionyl-tRNA formyltransferase [candidate division KSB1 bacterium]MDZ7276432.1 methionyl-tRNA formyltransferase [candidate division KSB1 bacterium]MDZ7288102.1 methionyl-tRNA formyltransferase [candidate division KSB1 bacterium]MDZ7300203.1 methionyl-tRNA formyltransferase [candidate division KSB1 bacterium]MDZ7305774.1 methionyl-tRNA formyltransferase [candidate division KSB1 bacterium]